MEFHQIIVVSFLPTHVLNSCTSFLGSTTPTNLVVDNVQVTRDQLVFQVCSVRQHDLVAFIGDDDARSSETDTFAKPHVARDGQVVELDNVGDGFEALFKVLRGISIGLGRKYHGERHNDGRWYGDLSVQLTATFLKWSPSLTTGVPPNSLDLSIVKTPCSRLYSLDLIRSKSLRGSISRFNLTG